ncbi:MAG: arginine N-succinyltransferase [Gammaproteobacteria bacterium]|nr:arginine N-succinyltransferase [Gammaproteobacteria bacterium]MDD9959549.1 arginine N-succinyltransferase [Gammaproteobacteria bacterium]
MLIRTATKNDLSSLLKLSAMLPPGMTSMPFDKNTWEKKLDLLEDSLEKEKSTDLESVYLLVLEDPEKKEIVGTAGIVAGVGLTRPFYNYKLSKESKFSEALDIRVTSNLLNLVNDFTGETELISLFLMPDYRRNGIGQFLSRCRYLFMSDFPERFSDIVFAEIRGWLNESEKSPFWEHLGKKFFNLPFARADFISAVNGSQFISDLMPRFPVYLELLPEEAVEVIGKAHEDSVPAKKLLEREGFSYLGTVDIFDAGPVMECERANIESIKNARTLTIQSLVKEVEESATSSRHIVSNRQLPDYKLIMAPIKQLADDEVVISEKDAELLGVNVGSQVQALEMR